MATDTESNPRVVSGRSLFTDIHICEMRNRCGERAESYALFRGSLTPVCKECARVAVEEYDADLYNSRGTAVQLQKMAGRDVIVRRME